MRFEIFLTFRYPKRLLFKGWSMVHGLWTIRPLIQKPPLPLPNGSAKLTLRNLFSIFVFSTSYWKHQTQYRRALQPWPLLLYPQAGYGWTGAGRSQPVYRVVGACWHCRGKVFFYRRTCNNRFDAVKPAGCPLPVLPVVQCGRALNENSAVVLPS